MTDQKPPPRTMSKEISREARDAASIILTEWLDGLGDDYDRDHAIACREIQSAIDQSTSAMRDGLERVELYREYIRLLGDELNEVVHYAAAHGWKSTRHVAGLELRRKLGILNDNEV